MQDVHLIPAQESKFLCTSLLIDRKGGGSESVTRLRQEKFQLEMQKSVISHQVQILEQISEGAVKYPLWRWLQGDVELLRVLGLHLATGGEPEGAKSLLVPQRDTQVVCSVSERNQA